MGKVTGFLEFEREERDYQPVAERIKHWREFVLPLPEDEVRQQGARCMDCGVPYCHGTDQTVAQPTGCPVNNQIPDWNDLVYRGNWEQAAVNLHSTNNFPEVTGRVCPAPCEASCTLNIDDNPVAIKTIECAIADRAFESGWIKPEPASHKTGKKVAVVGSGPAGMACAQQLARAGHDVHVYEKYAKAGGLMRYGIPDFKMEKHLIDRRLEQMRGEGIRFMTNAHVGQNVPVEDLRKEFDALLLAGGAEQPRDLNVPGRELRGIHFAMEFLPQGNRRSEGDIVPESQAILATGKRVVIIGGGDTGADCLGTSHRQKALAVHQFELLPKPPDQRAASTPWPLWPMQLRIESSHEEGGIREWSVSTTHFTSDANGNVKALHGVRIGPPPKFEPVPSTEFSLDTDLVLLAMGFLGPVRNGMIEQLGLKLDQRGNVSTDENYMTSVPGVFAGGDMRRGQSLVVWAITEGRKAARGVDQYLMGETKLP
jgi:glutamate synthase (NADPH/NADH) small chain